MSNESVCNALGCLSLVLLAIILTAKICNGSWRMEAVAKSKAEWSVSPEGEVMWRWKP